MRISREGPGYVNVKKHPLIKSYEKMILETLFYFKDHVVVRQCLSLYSCPATRFIKRNEIELFVVRWMDLESVIQSELSQKDKNKYCMLTHIYGI